MNTLRDRLCQDVADLAAKARRYWRTSGQNAALEAEITENFDHFFFRLDEYFYGASDRSKQSGIDELAEEFHITATSGSFATLHRTADPIVENKVKVQALALKQLIFDLDLSPR
jgi:hypothetical protein